MKSKKSFVPCDNCQNGYLIDNKGQATKCDCLKTYQFKMYGELLLLQSNVIEKHTSKDTKSFILNYDITKDYKGKDINENIPKIKKFISSFKESFSSTNMFWQGSHGTQKSSLARYILKELVVKNNLKCFYIDADSLIKLIIKSARDESLLSEIDRIMHSDLLIIDEMSEDKIVMFQSGWQTKYFFPFIKKRLEGIGRSTLFISNSPIDNLGEAFKGGVQEVIERSVSKECVLTFNEEYAKNKGRVPLKSIWD